MYDRGGSLVPVAFYVKAPRTKLVSQGIKPPNIIPTNISGHAVLCCTIDSSSKYIMCLVCNHVCLCDFTVSVNPIVSTSQVFISTSSLPYVMSKSSATQEITSFFATPTEQTCKLS